MTQTTLHHYYITWFVDGFEDAVLSYFSSERELALDDIMRNAAASESVNLEDITYTLCSIIRTDDPAFVIW